jgi:preprotein translocase subunit SecA
MDTLREGIGLRAYGQKDPLVEYRREAFENFQSMILSIKEEALSFIFRVQPMSKEEIVAPPPPKKKAAPMQFLHPEAGSVFQPPTGGAPAQDGGFPQAVQAEEPKEARSVQIGRNDPCPCGSGKKYKKCHGQ